MPAPGLLRRLAVAVTAAAACHAVFALGVGAMVLNMGFGMTLGLGRVPEPWSWAVNLLLLLQFALGHSLLLMPKGRQVLARLAPAPFGADLAPTTYVAIAGLQILVLFALWTPSGTVWWQAEGPVLGAMLALYLGAWALLGKAMLDAGIWLQSGVIGWWAVLRGTRPRYPDLPTGGLFRWIRQPIYATFALTTWTTPTWTPDQLLVATVLTLYCLLGPLLKERRWQHLFGQRFAAYRARTPYFLPGWPMGSNLTERSK
jgi:protein-S-isoprenylcysteine O-methyltransferase Ste14